VPNQPLTPTCPNCGYDLTGLIEPDSSAACPECNTQSTFAQAIYRKPKTPTIKRALIWLFLIPTIASFFSWALLYLGTRLEGAELVFFLFIIFFNIAIPIYAIVLLVQEWKSRLRIQAYYFRLPVTAAILIIILCAGLSELILWLSIMDWVEAIANV